MNLNAIFFLNGSAENPTGIFYLLVLLIAYVIGSIPTGFLVVKQLTGQDIREVGSGSTGATNVRRAAGNKAAIGVLVGDLLKGFLPVLAVRLIWPTLPWCHVLVAVGVVLGHSRSVFLNFTGGKSAASGLGTMLGLAPWVALTAGVTAYGVSKLSRFVSLGSICAALIAPPLLVVLGEPFPYFCYGLIASIYVIFLHRENVKRLLQGTENRLQ